jgi:hypothetical protein
MRMKDELNRISYQHWKEVSVWVQDTVQVLR